MNFSDLIAYFESLARRHADIRHSEHEKHFFRFEVDEVLAGINRTDVAYPMLVLEGYNFDFTDKQSDNLIKNRSGAFILLGMVTRYFGLRTGARGVGCPGKDRGRYHRPDPP